MAKKNANKSHKYQAQQNAKAQKNSHKHKKSRKNKRHFPAPTLANDKQNNQNQQKSQQKSHQTNQAKTQTNAKTSATKANVTGNQAQTKTQTNDASLYGYTLQAIPCHLTEAEMHQAQMELFDQTNKIKNKIWAILAVVAAIAIAGIVYFKGYQTVFFWLMLSGVVTYLLFKFVGVKLYMKRELSKQTMPEELKDIRLGLQPHGLVMSVPGAAAQQMAQMATSKSNKSMMTLMKKNAGGDIPWSAMTDWKETTNFFFVMFDLKGQAGSQIIPKRLVNQQFPMENLAKHLKDNVKQQD